MTLGRESGDFARPDVSPRSILDLSRENQNQKLLLGVIFRATYLSDEHDRKKVEYPFAEL
jgi:hypothetical protein